MPTDSTVALALPACPTYDPVADADQGYTFFAIAKNLTLQRGNHAMASAFATNAKGGAPPLPPCPACSGGGSGTLRHARLTALRDAMHYLKGNALHENNALPLRQCIASRHPR